MGELGINLPGLLVQIINVALVLIILRLVLYKPILRLLENRSSRIKESLEAAEAARPVRPQRRRGSQDLG